MKKIKRIRFLAMLLCVVMTLNAVPLTANAVGEDSLNEDPITQQPSQIPDEAATTVPNENEGCELALVDSPNGDVAPAVVPPYQFSPSLGDDTGGSYTPSISNGIYRIKHAASGLYLDVRDGGWTPGTVLQLWDGTGYENNRNMLFKITYIGRTGTEEHYTIRSMRNSALGVEGSLTENYQTATIESISLREIPAYIESDHQWTFIVAGDHYFIRNGEGEEISYLTSYVDDEDETQTGNGVEVYMLEVTTGNGLWDLEAYTGEDLNGAGIFNPTSEVIEGETYDFDAYIYSSLSGINGPPVYSVKSTDGGTTDKATIDTDTGVLTTLKPGQIRVCVSFTGSNSNYWYLSITIRGNREGIYFFENEHHATYIQISQDEATLTEGAEIESAFINGSERQQFELVWVEDIFYKIICVASNMALTAPALENGIITQATYSGLNTQQWSITDAGEGLLKFSPRSNPTLFLSTRLGLIANGYPIYLRDESAGGRDEWILKTYIYAISNRLPHADAQNKTNWCWAACAKMVGEHNGGSGALDKDPVILTETSNLANELRSYNDVPFYGNTIFGDKTADGGQCEIVISVYGNDGNHTAGFEMIETALHIASLNLMSIGALSNDGELNQELASGYWVIGCLSTRLDDGPQHAIVIKNYDPVSQYYTFWDPATNLSGGFYRADMLNDEIVLSGSMINWKLIGALYCN